MWKGFAMLAAIIALVVGFLAFWSLMPRTTAFGMFESEGDVNIARVAFTFGATIAGVVLGSVYRQLRRLEGPRIEDVPGFLSGVARSVDLWLGLVGAPIVFALLLQSSDGMSTAGLFLVGLENGFCCLIIVNGFIGRTETEVQKGVPVVLPPGK